MKAIKNNQAPHVESGMHYNLQRFEELYRWISALQMDSIFSVMQPFGFGLLAYENVETDFQLERHGYQLQVIRCCGITKNGGIVGLFEGVNAPLSYDTNECKKDGIYDILISVDNETRTQIGEESEIEEVLRQPFSLPSYKIHLHIEGSKDNTSYFNALHIGQLKKEGMTIELLEEQYIPVSKHVGATSVLHKKFLEYEEIFGNFYKSLQEVSRLTENVVDTEQASLNSMSKSMGNFLAANKWIFELGAKATTYQLFQFCKSFATVVQFNLDASNRSTQLLGLIRQNVSAFVGAGSEFEIQSFRNVVQDLVDTPYSHYQIKEWLDKIDNFIKVVYRNSFQLLGSKKEINQHLAARDSGFNNIVELPMKEKKKAKKNGPFF